MDLISLNQRDAAARTLSEAFQNDPLLQILEPNEHKRPKVGPWFFSKTIAYGMRWGRVWGNEDASAVAVWFPPGNTDVGVGRMLRVGFGALPFKIGLRGVGRFMKAMAATEKFHKLVEGPHWYLMTIGTQPARQGEGLGTALLELGTLKADEAGIPCYLETGTEGNVAFYSKRGFEVTGQASLLGFTVYGMVRGPQ
jgi:ribosomal protein S18 acetylase RimI-like enzyme